jgi:hypothetical protein
MAPALAGGETASPITRNEADAKQCKKSFEHRKPLGCNGLKSLPRIADRGAVGADLSTEQGTGQGFGGASQVNVHAPVLCKVAAAHRNRMQIWRSKWAPNWKQLRERSLWTKLEGRIVEA